MERAALKPAILYGIIAGAVTFGWMLFEFAVGLHEGDVGKYTGFISLLIAVAFVYAAVRVAARDARQPWSSKRSAVVGAVASFSAAVIISAGLFLYHGAINPDFVDERASNLRKELVAEGVSETEVNERVNKYRQMESPATQSMALLVVSPISGALLGWLSWLLLRRRLNR